MHRRRVGLSCLAAAFLFPCASGKVKPCAASLSCSVAGSGSGGTLVAVSPPIGRGRTWSPQVAHRERVSGQVGTRAARAKSKGPESTKEAQEAAPKPRRLERVSAVRFPVPAPTTTGPSNFCDGEGNLYLLYSAARPKPGPGPAIVPSVFGQPVTELVLNSQSVKRYAVQSLDGYQTFSGMEFSVDREGEVYRQFRAQRSSADESEGEATADVVVKFHSDGSVDSAVALQNPPGGRLDVVNFAAFADGSLLVTGILRPSQSAPGEQGMPARKLKIIHHMPLGFRPFTAIFDGDGGLVRVVSLPGDTGPGAATPGAGHTAKHGHGGAAAGRHADANKGKEALQPPPGMRWVAHVFGTLVAPGPGDTAYLLRPGNPPTLYALSSDGSVLHNARIRAYPAKAVRPLQMGVAGRSRVLIVFFRTSVDKQGYAVPTTTLSIVDPANGRVAAAYLAPKGLVTGCATSPTDFEFLKWTKDRKLEVVKYTGP